MKTHISRENVKMTLTLPSPTRWVTPIHIYIRCTPPRPTQTQVAFKSMNFQQKAGGFQKKFQQIQIPILFGLRKSADYEYYSVLEYHSNTNTNTIRVEQITRIRIRILFGFKKSSEYEYEYYSVLKNHPNTNTNTSIRPQLFE